MVEKGQDVAHAACVRTESEGLVVSHPLDLAAVFVRSGDGIHLAKDGRRAVLVRASEPIESLEPIEEVLNADELYQLETI